MARSISESAEVQQTATVVFDLRRVLGVVVRKQGGVTMLVADVELEDTETGIKKNNVVSIEIGNENEPSVVLPTVQGVIDDIESFTGSTVDLSTLSIVDFIHSIVHERLNA